MRKKILLAFLISLLFFGCKVDAVYTSNSRIIFDKNSKKPLITFLLDTNDNESVEFNKQLKKTINYTKIPYKELKFQDFNATLQIPKTTKVLVIKDVEALNHKTLEKIIYFLIDGNTLVLLNAAENKNANFLMGLKTNTDIDTNIKAKGFYFKNSFIPSFKNRGLEDLSPHFGYERKNFIKDIEIVATAFDNDQFPTIIKNKIGAGSVMYFNTTKYPLKENRGFIFPAILAGLDQTPYPIANVSSFDLDDFPAPLYVIKKEPVYSTMNLTQDKFYTDIWWPDMVKLAAKYNLKYTTYPAFDYRGLTEPPFFFNEWNLKQNEEKDSQISESDLLMKDVVAENHELGLHGYNHVSLIKTDWTNQSFMEASLKVVLKKWKVQGYGDLPESYVPPSNQIDSIGVNALKNAMPNINVISGLYFGDFEEGAEREFDPEPYNTKVFDFPRVSSGYDIDAKERYSHYSTFLYTGIWNHFLHPDDVFQIDDKKNSKTRGRYKFRNEKNLGWRNAKDGSLGMLGLFEEYIIETQELFPLLKSYKNKNAVMITKKWRNQKFDINNTERLVSVKIEKNKGKYQEYYWFMYVKNEDSTEIENSLLQQKITFSKTEFLDGFLFHVKTTTPEIEIVKPEKLLPQNSEEIKRIALQNFENYKAGKPIFESLQEEIDFYVDKGNIIKAIELLKQKIISNSDFNLNDWLKLNQLYIWNNKSEKTWAFLDEKYLENPKKEYVTFSKRLFAINYPTLNVRKIWLLRQLKASPNNLNLKLEYNQYFESETFSKLSADEVILLINKTNNINFYAILINDHPEKALEIFRKKTPCKDNILHVLADRVAWLFANKEEFKEALAWSNCTTNIDPESLKNWRINVGDSEFLKNNYFDEYIIFLLQNTPSKALTILDKKEPCKDNELYKTAADIAYAYGNTGRIRKALAWANCSENFSTADKMQWAFQLQNYKLVEELYNDGLAKNTNTDREKQMIIELYLEKKSYLDAFFMATQLQASTEKELLKKRLNELIFYISTNNQKIILQKYSGILYPETIKKITKEIRIKNNKTIELTTNLLTDKLEPTSYKTLATFNIKDKKEQRHSFGISQNTTYALKLSSQNTANFTQDFYGIYYGFKFKERLEKLNFYGTTMLEFNKNSNLFYHINLGTSISKNNLYSSLQISHQPAITSPAYNLNIYRTQLAIYEELNFKKRYQAILSVEGNNYSDNEQDILLVTKFGVKLNAENKNVYIPFIESAGMFGTKNNSIGFPYWTIEERFYAGLGFNYRYKNEATSLEFGINSGAFLDTFSGSFFRYGTNLNYPISDYFSINGNAEFYTIKKFYSNNFTFGLKYYLK